MTDPNPKSIDVPVADEDAVRAAREVPYPWGPKDYRRFTMLISVAIHAYLYLGMVGLVYFLNGESWILGWQPLVLALVSATVFSRVSLGWVMRLDAQFGRGSGWILKPVLVKLPELRDRPSPK